MLNTEQFAADYEKLHASYERQAYQIIKRALDTQKRAVIDYVQKSESNIILLPIYLPQLLDAKVIEAAYLDIYTQIGIRHARNYARLLDRLINGRKGRVSDIETKAIGFSSEFWRRIMAEFFANDSSSKITGVNQTTIARIQVVLADAQQQNMSTFQQSRYLVDQLKDARFNATRAMLIARTESTVGANVAANKVAEEADFVLLKKWVDAKDRRERASHKVVGRSEPIAMNALFEVPSPKGLGMEYALYPGANTLSIGNLANCRCIVAHLPALDEDGLPIPK